MQYMLANIVLFRQYLKKKVHRNNRGHFCTQKKRNKKVQVENNGVGDLVAGHPPVNRSHPESLKICLKLTRIHVSNIRTRPFGLPVAKSTSLSCQFNKMSF